MSFVYMIIMVIVLAAAIAIHELGHYIYLKKAKVYVHEFSIGFGPVLWKTKRGETQISFRAIPLGGYVLPATTAKTKFYKEIENDAVVKAVDNDEIKKEIKLQEDQEFVKKNGKTMLCIKKQEYFVEGRNVEDTTNVQKLKYILAGVTFNLLSGVILFLIMSIIYHRGFAFQSFGNFMQVIGHVFSSTARGFGLLIGFIGGLFVGRGTDQIQSVVGIVGSSESIITTAGTGFEEVMYMIIGVYFAISINLVVLNLLPVPPLDGFKIYSTIYTMITKKQINPDVEEKVTNVAATILMMLFGFLIIRDIFNFF